MSYIQHIDAMTALAALPASAPRLAEPPSPPPTAPASGPAPQLGGGRAPIALSDLGIKLSQQAAKRSELVGQRTVDLAQDFLSNFTSRYIGEGATVSFDSAGIDTSSSLQASGSHTEGPDGTVDAAGFSLKDSAHFIGKGKITTADGQTFEFEIEVQYELSIEASSSRSNGAAAPNASPAQDVPAGPSALAGLPSTGDASGQPGVADAKGNGKPVRELPPLDFKGDLEDLFKLLGRELRADIKPQNVAGGEGEGGNLTLRLIKLISPQTEKAGPANDITPAQQALNKAATDSYATSASTAQPESQPAST